MIETAGKGDCRKTGLPGRGPTTKAKKMFKTVVSTKGNRASWHRCQNLRKGFPEAPGSSQWLPEASRKVPEAYLKQSMGQNRLKCETVVNLTSRKGSPPQKPRKDSKLSFLRRGIGLPGTDAKTLEKYSRRLPEAPNGCRRLPESCQKLI